MKKKLTIIIGAVIFLSLLLFYFINSNKSLDIKGYEISKTSYTDIISSIGTVEYEKEIQIKSEVSGTLLEVYNEVGDRIKIGDTIAKIDDKEAQILYKETNTKLGLAKGRYNDYMNSFYEDEKSNLDQRLLQENEINTLKLEQSQLNTKIIETKVLVDEGILPLSDLNTLYNQMAALKLKIVSANSKLVSLRNPILSVEELKASIQSSNEEISKQALELTKYKLNSPIDGVVIERFVEPGSFVQSGETLLKIASDTEKYAVVDIDEKFIGKISIGTESKIVIESYPNDIFKGVVEFIGPEVDKNSGTINLKIRILEKKELFLQNMTVKTEFVSESFENVVVIPGYYLTNDDDSMVFIKNDKGLATKKKITIYNKNNTNVMVLNGLDEGDVILDPTNLEEGQKISKIISSKGETTL